jgi:hypothetical protein
MIGAETGVVRGHEMGGDGGETKENNNVRER